MAKLAATYELYIGIVVGIGSLLLSVFVVKYQRQVIKRVREALATLWRFLLAIVALAVAVLGAWFGSSVDGVDPRLRWSFIGLSAFVFVKDLIDKRSSSEKQSQDEIKELLLTLAQDLSKNGVDVNANVMVLNGDCLEMKVSTSEDVSPIVWEIGQGVCGVAVETKTIRIGPLDMLADAATFDDLMDVNHGGTPWRINRRQWSSTKSVRTVLAKPIISASGRRLGVLNLHTTSPIGLTGFTDLAVQQKVDFQALAISRQLGKTGWI